MKRLKFRFILLILFGVLTSISQTYAQGKTFVRGTVTDTKDKGSLPGVSIAELDKDNRTISGTTTDMNGNFALKISNPNNKIVFSFIGYKTITEPIGGRSTINISLESSTIELQTVEIKGRTKVTTGMMSVDERDLTSSVSKISTESLEGIQAASIDEALQGRMAGVDIVSTSGDPGAGMSIRIRGTSSLTASSDPLIVVDNMASTIEVSDDFDFGSADEQSYSQLLNIPMGDIKEITVLKDAAATAVWGAQASNGVLMITTKRGSKSVKPMVSISAKGTITQQPSAIPLLSGSQYTTMVEEAWMNAKNVPLSIETYKEFANDPNDPYYYYNYGQNTDWVKAITQIGYVQSYNMAVSGGGDKTKYRASVDYNGSQGTTIGTYFKRLTARVNLDYDISTRLHFRADIAYTHSDNDRNYVNSKDAYDNVRAMAYYKMPNMSIYEYDINGKETSNYFTPESNIQGTFPGTYNPVAMVKLGQNNIFVHDIAPSASIKFQAIPQILTFSADMSFMADNNRNNLYLPKEASGVDQTSVYSNLSTEKETDYFKTTTKTSILFTPKLNENNSLMTMAMFSTDNIISSYTSNISPTASSELVDPSSTTYTSSTAAAMISSSYKIRGIAALLQAQYKFMDRYIVNASIRMDGSSKFGSKKRYGYFPSISGRWRISGEPFMKNAVFINELSLKGSYGISGNTPTAAYNFASVYTSSGTTYLGNAAVSPSNMELTNYHWENVHQTDIGINLQMFKNRLNVDLDWYRKRTKDMLLNDLSISSLSGFSNVDLNGATMDNQGWEITVDATVLKLRDLTARFSINVSRNENLIRSVSKFFSTKTGSYTANGSYYVDVANNTPFGSFYGYRYKGVYKNTAATIATDKFGNQIYDALGNPLQMKFFAKTTAYQFQAGDAKYEDINNDGSIDGSDVVWLGDSNPRLTGGFGPTFIYKNITLNLYFHYRLGNDIINRTKMGLENMRSANNQSTRVLRRWRKEGDETDIPRALYGMGYNYLGSDRFVEDGSFMRFKYITISYKIRKGIQKFGLNSISTYCTVNNLFTWTKYSGQDPEISIKSTTSNRFAIGYDDSKTPPTFGITIGADIQF